MLPLPDQLGIHVINNNPGQSLGVGLDETDHLGPVHLTGFGQGGDFPFLGHGDSREAQESKSPNQKPGVPAVASLHFFLL
jgi:hypothetical protein